MEVMIPMCLAAPQDGVWLGLISSSSPVESMGAKIKGPSTCVVEQFGPCGEFRYRCCTLVIPTSSTHSCRLDSIDFPSFVVRLLLDLEFIAPWSLIPILWLCQSIRALAPDINGGCLLSLPVQPIAQIRGFSTSTMWPSSAFRVGSKSSEQRSRHSLCPMQKTNFRALQHSARKTRRLWSPRCGYIFGLGTMSPIKHLYDV